MKIPLIISTLIFHVFGILSLHAQSCDSEIGNESEKESEKTKEEEPPKIGNFALPVSQQPAALFGFGGNIIEKGEVQLYFFGDCLAGKKRVVSDLIPSVLFGITDDWSILFAFPFTPLFKDGRDQSRGLEDFYLQLEYAFF